MSVLPTTKSIIAKTKISGGKMQIYDCKKTNIQCKTTKSTIVENVI